MGSDLLNGKFEEFLVLKTSPNQRVLAQGRDQPRPCFLGDSIFQVDDGSYVCHGRVCLTQVNDHADDGSNLEESQND